VTVARMSITIACPIDRVFRVLTTPEDTPKWSSNAVEKQLTSPGPVGVDEAHPPGLAGRAPRLDVAVIL
jgi:uncharacterized protein YndB with AHSA1/START domain